MCQYVRAFIRVHACVRACVCECMRAGGGGGGGGASQLLSSTLACRKLGPHINYLQQTPPLIRATLRALVILVSQKTSL